MKRKLACALWTSITFLSLASGILASIAWFNVENNLKVGVSGSVVEEYFHSGYGTEASPFIITRPIHYYHLVEFYQRKTNLPSPYNVDFGKDYLYFQVGLDFDGDGTYEVYNYDNQGIYQGTSGSPSYSKVLNMAYYSDSNSLMPIGTNEIPFIGQFDGSSDKGITISNINIHCSETVVVNKQNVTRTASDIGVFGYVADEETTNHTKTVIKNSKFDGVTIDLSDVTSTVASSQSTISHVSTHTGQAYVGYVAGHVRSYTNYNSTGPVNASPLYNVYVDNATVKGGAGVACNYGYIGFVDTIDGDTTATVSGEVAVLSEGGGGSEHGDDWGGSINFKEFNMRFYNRSGTFTYSTNKRLGKYETNYTKASIAYGSSVQTLLQTNPVTSSTNIVYNLQGSGSHTITYNSGKNSDTYTLVGTAMPLSIGNDGVTSANNTGYIVSSSRSTSGSANGAVRSASYRNGRINNSLSDVAKTTQEVCTSNGNTIAYDRTKTEILTNKNKTYNTSGTGTDNFVLIKDELEGYNQNHTPGNTYLTNYTKNNTTVPGDSGLKLKKYNDSRQTLDTVFTGTTKVQGIHFMNAAISPSNAETLPIVKINGTTYSNSSYPLLKNCIDFKTKESGLINFFAGSYFDFTGSGGYTNSAADCFFSLYVVDRNETTHAINSVKLLSNIYKDNRDSKAYIYQYSDGTYSDNGTTTKSDNVGDIVFDMRYLSETPPVQNALYYFEIPVNKGEFALGGVSGQDAGAYLLYLDIAANKGDETPTFNEENMVRDASLFTQIDFQINTPVINSCFNIAYVIPAGSTKEKFSITVTHSTVTIDQHDYFCYEVVIVNTSGSQLELSALLMDNNSDPDDEYYYMYAIKYNAGTRTEYHSSNTYRGASSADTMTPVYS